MTGWPTVTVGAIAAPGARSIAIGPFGSRMKADNYVDSGVPVVRGNNITKTRNPTGDFVFITEELADSMPGCILTTGDLVFPHRGAIGEVGLIEGNAKMMLSTSLMKLTPDTSFMDPTFVYYYFRSDLGRGELLMRSSTVGTPGIGQPLSSLRSIPIPVPPIEEQRGIAATLGALDDKIESNRRAEQLILDLADGIYLAACSDGGHRVLVGDVAEFHNRRRIPLSSQQREQRVGPYPYYGATGVFGCVDDYLFDEVLVLVGEDGSVVNSDGTPVTQYIWGKTWINNHAHPLTGRGIPNELLLLALRRSDVRPIVTGAVQPKISMGNLKQLELVMPSAEAICASSAELGDLFNAYRHLEGGTSRLIDLRDTLLPELLSGRIRVLEARDAVVEAVG